MLLTSENIEFYSQRRKQYTQDFLKSTNQFKPKLEQLKRRLIAQKQMIDTPIKISSTTQKGKKISRVLLSLSKSKEVQNKIDKEMNRCSYQYEFEEPLNCKFNYSQTCKNIQQSMMTLMENIKEQIKEKHQELKMNTDNSNQYQKREQLEKIKLKSSTYSKIIEKLQQMHIQKQQLVTNEKQSFQNLEKLSFQNLVKFDKIEEQDQICKYSEKPITTRRTLESQMQFEEDKRIQKTLNNSQIDQEPTKNLRSQNLDQIIRKNYKKMGLLNRKQESMMDLKNIINNQRTTTQENIYQQNDVRQQYSKHKINQNKRFSLTILSSQCNSSNLNPIFDEQNGIITCVSSKTKRYKSLEPKTHEKQKISLKKYHEDQQIFQAHKFFQKI
ncbi:unnamed protein product [Paramecium sonneborni]|uniref:Uncharacterized protein n=1 Tax=Paramecium sonneborni TaxID=65129 RepID=A0A8S1K668_9CILI|nr:unnamed protein product [Paramecium sonneborni]